MCISEGFRSISIVVINACGRLLTSALVETQGQALVAFMQGQRGTLHVTFEQATCAAWLYDFLAPHVGRVVVCDPRHNALLQAGSKIDPSMLTSWPICCA